MASVVKPEDQGIIDRIREYKVDDRGYPLVNGFESPPLSSEESWSSLIKTLEYVLTANYGSNELLHGHILK